MAYQLAPYNNAMRLGQGFNSYTQQICIDDAVVVDPERAENILSNDGTTMRILAQSMGKPSAWSRQKEIVSSETDRDLVSAAKGGELPSTSDMTEIADAKPIEKVSLAGLAEQKGDGATAHDAEDTKPAVEQNDDANSDPEPEVEDEPSSETAVEKEKSKTNEPDGVQVHSEAKNDKDDTGKSGSIKETATKKLDGKTKSIPRTSVTKASTDKKSGVKKTASAAFKEDTGEKTEKNALLVAERERELEEKKLRREREKEMREDEKERKEEEKRRREETRKLVEWGASTVGYSKEELAAMKQKLNFEDRFTGMLENKRDFEFDPAIARGPSQIVTYTSRFIDKLSDITDDMNISGSLSIKAGKFGGSGRGAFIDSDKFKQSDLNFYISVKVANQSINFKDALVYNPVGSVSAENFREVFGDSFISGFEEGGEFNALVSMKILNKAKKTDIQAEAKIAFTTGPVDIKAEANVNIAKTNIETNTETTIQVSWSGGGHIKPREQQWDIQSLMQAAARFPDLVAECPQRTYAIITKYDTLRSFVKLKPAGYTKLQYENAQLYTNAMMDTYMSYKSLYTKISSNIFDVRNKTKIIKPWPENSKGSDETTREEPASKVAPDSSPFPTTLGGLEAAKKAIRHQMALIVNEVDLIEKDPKLATDDHHEEPFQSAAAFEERIPTVEAPEKPKVTTPLSGKRIMAKTQTEEELNQETEKETASPNIIEDNNNLSEDETTLLDKLKAQHPGIGKNLRATAPVGSCTKGRSFNNLEYLQPEWNMTKVQIEVAQGAISAIWIYYDNGLILSRGKAKNGRLIELSNFRPDERITAAIVQTGKGPDEVEPHVISLHLYTNRGRNFVGQAAKSTYIGDQKHSRDDVTYAEVVTSAFDMPFKNGSVKGFWGRSDDTAIWRLGVIWGDLNQVPQTSLQSTSQDNITVTDPVTTALTEAAKAQQECNAANTKAIELSRQLTEIKQKYEQEQSKLGLAERAVLPLPRNNAYNNGRVQIHFMFYGGEAFWNDDLARRCIDFAQRQVEFDFNDQFFGRDPWPGTTKSGAILYRYDNTGDMRYIIRRQNEKAKFDWL